MKDEIRQNGQVILSSDDGISIPMTYNNLVGVNMQVEYFRDGRFFKSCTIPNLLCNNNQ